MEVNCETDFVARSDDFCELVELMCMQLTVSPDIRFISSSQARLACLPAASGAVRVQQLCREAWL